MTWWFLTVTGLLMSASSAMGCDGWPVSAGSLREEKVRRCLSLGADANAQASGGTALHWAAVGNNAAAITVLAEAGADLEESVDEGATPLHWAAKYGNLSAIKALAKAGAVMNSRDQFGNAPVHWAARGESQSELGLWAPPDEYEGNASSHAVDVLIAADVKSAEGIELLLGLGAAADSRNMDQGTALHEASWLGKARTIRALSVPGVDVDARVRWRGGATALHIVASRSSGTSPLPARVAAGAIKALVEAGANVNEPFGDEAPLGLLTDAGNAAAVWFLLEAGAEVDRRHPRGGHTALHLASHRTDAASVVRLLLEAGADVDARDGDGNAPMHWAASGNSPAAIRMLADSGADVDARGGQEQRNAVDKALLEGNVAAIQALAETGAELGPRSNKDFPLYWARTFERAAFEAWNLAVRQRNQQEQRKQ